MFSDERSDVGRQLDEDHAPETNGRMSVCRRCGNRTDSPTSLHHAPAEFQLPRAADWLIAQTRRREIELANEMRAH